MITIQKAFEQSKTQVLSWVKFTRYIQPGLEIQEATSSLSAGIFHLDWSGRGQLALSDGQIFDWLPGDRWGKDWQFNHSSRIPLLYFQLHKKWLTIDAQIQATHETPGEPALSLMVLSGWFYLALNSAGKQTGILLNQ